MKRDLQRLYPWFGAIFAVAVIAGVGAVHHLRPQMAPEFSGQLASGDRVRLRDLRGKVVLLDFWASWCPPCRRSVPALERLSQRFGEDVAFYGINVEADIPAPRVAQIYQELGAGFETLVDPTGELQQRYQVDRLPTVFVLDPEGRIRHMESGLTDEVGVSEVIEGLLLSTTID